MVTTSPTSQVDNINNIVNKNLTQTEQAAQKAKTNYEDFLHLLTTQLQNQDPTAPTDTNQLTQQIATLSQVEQQINTNTNLEKLIGLYNTTTLNSVVSYIGKQVETDGNKGLLQNSQASFIYDLEKDAQTVDIKILDFSGKTVLTSNGTKVAGRNEVYWGGLDTDGKQMPDGAYTLEVTAKDAAGQVVKATTSTVGVVTSVDTKEGKIKLMLGDIEVELDKVKSVRQPLTVVQAPAEDGPEKDAA